jgi:4-amino-4-deoxy-L-arabinose transferase-like glycosyltransferase
MIPHRALAILLCLLGAGLRVANLGNVAFRTPDERVYTHQAKVSLQSGAAGIQAMVGEFERDPRAKDYPPPTRVGMYRLVALTMWVSGTDDESAGALFSCAASIGSLLVAAWIGVRFFPPWAALFGLLFYAVSPAELAIARRAWADAPLELLGILLFWIACEVAAGARRPIWFALFAAAGSLGIAVKESFPISYGLCGLWVLYVLAKDRDWKHASIPIGFGILGLAIALGWLANQVGGLSVLVRIMRGVPAANAVNTYAIEYASGPPWLLLDAFWIVSPVPALFGVAGFYAAFATQRNQKPDVLAGFAAVAAGHLAVMMALPHFLNLRYSSVVFGPFYLLAGLGFWYLSTLCLKWLLGSDRWVVTVLACAVTAIGAITDYSRFERFFVRDQAADLSIKMLRDEQNR